MSIRNELYAYLGGTIKHVGGIPIMIGGMPDHIHILSTFPRTITVAKYVEEIKKNSSKWIKTKGQEFAKFEWQAGYAIFSVSSSKLEAVSAYISNQETHHKRMTFKEELLRFFREYEVEYNEQYLWD